jgi:hypothetical protein
VFPNLDSPHTFSEKIQWLKLNYRNELMVQCADKFKVREYVESKIGSEYLNEIYGVYDSIDEVDFNELPNQFVLKPNNSSGRIIICKDKAHIDIKKVIRKAKSWEKENLFYITGEWIYKDIPYKLICEHLLEDNIKDYKFFFSNGNYIVTKLISNRHNGFFMDYFDENWNKLEIERDDRANSPQIHTVPNQYDEMLKKAAILAEPFPFSRIDFYYIDDRIIFGEVSFFPNNGFVKFKSPKMDEYISKRIQLPLKRE